MRKLTIFAVFLLLLAAAVPASAAYEAAVPETGVLETGTVMGTLGAELYATQQQTMTTTGLDADLLMEGVNQGVEYGFAFATGFIPLVVVLVGFAVAGGVLGLMVKLGPQIARMIKNAF